MNYFMLFQFLKKYKVNCINTSTHLCVANNDECAWSCDSNDDDKRDNS